MVTIKTSKGDIKLELFANAAPETVKNFLTYVKDGFYKNTIFHRVIPGFMIQGGGMDTDFNQKPTRSPIKNEAANQPYVHPLQRCARQAGSRGSRADQKADREVSVSRFPRR